MGTNCVPLFADLFSFCYERFQADDVEAFSPTSRYLDDLLNIDNPYFAQTVSQIYPTDFQLNKAEAPFWT